MASVRLTIALQDKIKCNISKAFDTPEKNAKETLAADFGDRCYKYALRKELETIEKLPKDFFQQSVSERFQFYHFSNKKISGYLNFTSGKSIPAKFQRYNNDFEIHNSALYDEYKAMINLVIEVRKEQQEVIALVEKGFENASTLKKLLTMIPQIEMFIPQHALDTHYERTESKPRVKREIKTVTAETNQIVAIAKLKMLGVGGN